MKTKKIEKIIDIEKSMINKSINNDNNKYNDNNRYNDNNIRVEYIKDDIIK